MEEGIEYCRLSVLLHLPICLLTVHMGLPTFYCTASIQGDLSHERDVRLSLCPSVSLSVRPSVKRVNCDKTKETCSNILIPHERVFILVF